MKNRNALLVSAVAYLVAVLAVARLARIPSTPAHVLAAVLMAAGIVVSAALTPRGPYTRRALVAAGLVLAASMTVPLAFVDDPAAWLRKTPSILGYLWVWMMILGLPSSSERRWCLSSPALLLASALLGGSVVLSAL
jgi:hypothetical protein